RVIPVPVRSRDLRGARVQPASRLKMPADAARRGWPLVGIEPSADTADEQADPRAAWAAPTVEKVPAEPVERVAQALAGETGVRVFPRADGQTDVAPGSLEDLVIRELRRQEHVVPARHHRHWHAERLKVAVKLNGCPECVVVDSREPVLVEGHASTGRRDVGVAKG